MSNSLCSSTLLQNSSSISPSQDGELHKTNPAIKGARTAPPLAHTQAFSLSHRMHIIAQTADSNSREREGERDEANNIILRHGKSSALTKKPTDLFPVTLVICRHLGMPSLNSSTMDLKPRRETTNVIIMTYLPSALAKEAHQNLPSHTKLRDGKTRKS